MGKSNNLFSMFILLMLSAYYGMTTLLKIGIILNLALLVVDIFRTVWGKRRSVKQRRLLRSKDATTQRHTAQ